MEQLGQLLHVHKIESASQAGSALRCQIFRAYHTLDVRPLHSYPIDFEFNALLLD